MVLGTSLEEYLSKHNLTIADKMLITEELLKKFISIDRTNNAIQYVLCDLNNLSIQNRRYLSFNNLFYFKKDNLNVSSLDVMRKLGYIILCIFANTPDADIGMHKDMIPPAMFSIITKCMEAVSYTHLDVYKRQVYNSLCFIINPITGRPLMDYMMTDDSIRPVSYTHLIGKPR